jgi:hypothetical protein
VSIFTMGGVRPWRTGFRRAPRPLAMVALGSAGLIPLCCAFSTESSLKPPYADDTRMAG